MYILLKEGAVKDVKTITEQYPMYYLEQEDYLYLLFKNDRELMKELSESLGTCYFTNVGLNVDKGCYALVAPRERSINIEAINRYTNKNYEECHKSLTTSETTSKTITTEVASTNER